MTTWHISNVKAARDLSVETEVDAQRRLKDITPAAPDFTKLCGPSSRVSRRFDGRKN